MMHPIDKRIPAGFVRIPCEKRAPAQEFALRIGRGMLCSIRLFKNTLEAVVALTPLDEPGDGLLSLNHGLYLRFPESMGKQDQMIAIGLFVDLATTVLGGLAQYEWDNVRFLDTKRATILRASHKIWHDLEKDPQLLEPVLRMVSNVRQSRDHDIDIAEKGADILLASHAIGFASWTNRNLLRSELANQLLLRSHIPQSDVSASPIDKYLTINKDSMSHTGGINELLAFHGFRLNERLADHGLRMHVKNLKGDRKIVVSIFDNPAHENINGIGLKLCHWSNDSEAFDRTPYLILGTFELEEEILPILRIKLGLFLQPIAEREFDNKLI